jgi:hypothetical protein
MGSGLGIAVKNSLFGAFITPDFISNILHPTTRLAPCVLHPCAFRRHKEAAVRRLFARPEDIDNASSLPCRSELLRRHPWGCPAIIGFLVHSFKTTYTQNNTHLYPITILRKPSGQAYKLHFATFFPRLFSIHTFKPLRPLNQAHSNTIYICPNHPRSKAYGWLHPGFHKPGQHRVDLFETLLQSFLNRNFDQSLSAGKFQQTYRSTGTGRGASIFVIFESDFFCGIPM